MGFGFTMPLAWIGAVASFRDSTLERGRFFALWVVMVTIGLIVINVPQTTRMVNGAHLPICVMAGLGWSSAMRWTRSLRQIRWRLPAYGLLWIVGISLFLTAQGMLLYGFRTHSFDRQLAGIAEDLRRASRVDLPRVLCDVRTARTLAVITPARVYAGHYALTPEYGQKRTELAACGFVDQPGVISPQPANQAAFEALLGRANVEFVVVLRGTPACQYAQQTARLRHLTQRGLWQLYRLDSPGSY
jgi:4-amino-4-deoxy-L-arabinose transferase-like glycosyltransferase